MNRMMICAIVVLAEVASASQLRPETQVSSQLPVDSELRRILSERIKGFEERVSITVGVIGPQGRRIVSKGAVGTNDSQPATGDTTYEVGSITKVFTALLLADMVEHHESALDDPVAAYLPRDVTVPTRAGRPITLADLATHRSGLPRMPSNFAPADPLNPYPDYSVERLYQFVSSYQLQREVDSAFEYSNLGAGLLGHALARRAGTSYETLLRRRVLDPLEMSSTGIALSPTVKTRQAQPHSSVFLLASTPPWEFTDAFAGAGALRSSAVDMLKFLAATLGYTKTPLSAAMARMLAVRRDGTAAFKIGLGWRVEDVDGTEIVWTGGATYGSRSFAGYDPKARVGVVVLSNYNSGSGIDDIGRHVLNPRTPLDSGAAVKPRARTVSTVPTGLVDAYAGRYRFSDNEVWMVRRDGNRYFMKRPGAAEFEIFPEGDFEKGNDDFFSPSSDALFTFDFEPSSPRRANQLTFSWGFFDPRRATRID
jgi:D-alanyl-D-alanine-carboxypeptidase/D-alanyl-D-alanine-endopeptidase